MREFFNNDCMDIMKQYPDDYFDLAIVDPPYFSGPEKCGVMVQTLEQVTKTESKRIKIPAKIRPFDVGYRVVNKHGQALALRNGASIFALPSLAEKAIKKEFGKNDPDFDIEEHSVEEVAIINLSKLHSYFDEVE